MMDDIRVKVDMLGTKLIEIPIIDEFKMSYCDTDGILFRIALRYHNYEIRILKTFLIGMPTSLFIAMDIDTVESYIKSELRKKLLEYIKL